ncbi:MAG: hypothetical protein JKY50_13025 [Oleispira sp.]|nr:hypothetical protein [Oleispira sp.]
MNKFEPVIILLNAFILEGVNSTSQSKAIESAIDDIFDDPDSFVNGLLDELSFYSPMGGDHLINYEDFLPKAKSALEYFEAMSKNA